MRMRQVVTFYWTGCHLTLKKKKDILLDCDAPGDIAAEIDK